MGMIQRLTGKCLKCGGRLDRDGCTCQKCMDAATASYPKCWVCGKTIGLGATFCSIRCRDGYIPLGPKGCRMDEGLPGVDGDVGFFDHPGPTGPSDPPGPTGINPEPLGLDVMVKTISLLSAELQKRTDALQAIKGMTTNPHIIEFIDACLGEE